MRVIFEKNLVFISKPRCGSTSVRRVLTKFIRKNYPKSDSNDLIVNKGGREDKLHPHINAPYLRELLKVKYKEKANNLKYFTVTRNPIEMLRSYYSFFKPDINSHYIYSKKYNGERISFLDWLSKRNGGGNAGSKRRKFAPSWISQKNFSTLSLEAFGFDKNNNNTLDHTFLIEEPKTLEYFLSNKLGEKISLPKINASEKTALKKIPDHILDLIKEQFPTESVLYNL